MSFNGFPQLNILKLQTWTISKEQAEPDEAKRFNTRMTNKRNISGSKSPHVQTINQNIFTFLEERPAKKKHITNEDTCQRRNLSLKKQCRELKKVIQRVFNFQVKCRQNGKVVKGKRQKDDRLEPKQCSFRAEQKVQKEKNKLGERRINNCG